MRASPAGALGGLVGVAAMDTAGVLLWPRADQVTRYGVATEYAARTFRRLAPCCDPAPRHLLPLLVHLTAGILTGAVYGALAPRLPALRGTRGGLFGVAVWLAGDEVAVPLLGLSPRPTDVPTRVHAYTFVTHVVYGLVTDRVTSALTG